MTHLRRMMLEELQRRNYAATTVQYYLQAVDRFAKHFKRSPDQLNQHHLRTYQAYLLRERKLEPRTVKASRVGPAVLLREDAQADESPEALAHHPGTRLIDGARTLTDRTMLMVLYSTGMRNAEMRSLQVQH